MVLEEFQEGIFSGKRKETKIDADQERDNKKIRG